MLPDSIAWLLLLLLLAALDPLGLASPTGARSTGRDATGPAKLAGRSHDISLSVSTFREALEHSGRDGGPWVSLDVTDADGNTRKATRLSLISEGGTKAAYNLRWEDSDAAAGGGGFDTTVLLVPGASVGRDAWEGIVGEELAAVERMRDLEIESIVLQRGTIALEDEGEFPVLLSRDFQSYAPDGDYIIDTKQRGFRVVPQGIWEKVVGGAREKDWLDAKQWARVISPAMEDIEKLNEEGWSTFVDRSNYILHTGGGRKPTMRIFMFDFASSKKPAWWTPGHWNSGNKDHTDTKAERANLINELISAIGRQIGKDTTGKELVALKEKLVKEFS